MTSVVTGVAGFVGSHLAARLLAGGERVLGIDCVTDYYDVAIKRANLQPLLGSSGFTFLESDLTRAPLDEIFTGVDVVYHLAGQPGVRASWGAEFDLYVERNVRATQALLEAARRHPLHKVVYASSSSVYGDAESYPMRESVVPHPVSPYGVTKLAAEHLCHVYQKAFGVPTASLRLFTVYGPGQRPDMAFSQLVKAAVHGLPFKLYGSGEQTRDFTYVDDVVTAFCDAGRSVWTGVANVGGGSRVSMNKVVEIVGVLVGGVHVAPGGVQLGDVRHTAADITVAREGFGYRPMTRVAKGLERMVAAERAAMSPKEVGAVPTAAAAPMTEL
jgi:nucleoside-diphosphate-sugar epimerase